MGTMYRLIVLTALVASGFAEGANAVQVQVTPPPLRFEYPEDTSGQQTVNFKITNTGAQQVMLGILFGVLTPVPNMTRYSTGSQCGHRGR